RNVVLRTIEGPELGEGEPQKVRDLGDCRDRRSSTDAGRPLLKGNRGRHAVDGVDIRARQGRQEASRIRRESLEEAALPLREDDVEGEGALARAARAGNRREL